jgi:hypothetical protein
MEDTSIVAKMSEMKISSTIPPGPFDTNLCVCIPLHGALHQQVYSRQTKKV